MNDIPNQLKILKLACKEKAITESTPLESPGLSREIIWELQTKMGVKSLQGLLKIRKRDLRRYLGKEKANSIISTLEKIGYQLAE